MAEDLWQSLCDYTRAVFPSRWLRRALAIATLIGGLAGVWYFLEKAGAGMTTLLVLMLILSAALNVRQFQVWRAAIRDARAAREDAARMRRMADSAWELYEYEETQNWTEKGVTCTVKQLPISQVGEPSTSLVEIKVSEVLFPVYLRLWCSSDVRTLPLPDIKIDNPGEPPKDAGWSPPTDNEKPVPIRSEGKGLAEIRIRDVSLTSESVLRLALESQSGEELQVFRVQRPKE